MVHRLRVLLLTTATIAVFFGMAPAVLGVGGEVELQAHASQGMDYAVPAWVEWSAIGVVAALFTLALVDAASTPPGDWHSNLGGLARHDRVDDMFFRVRVLAADHRTTHGYLRSLDELQATLLTRQPWTRGTKLNLRVATPGSGGETKSVHELASTVAACRPFGPANAWYMSRLRLGHTQDDVRRTDDVLDAIAHRGAKGSDAPNT